MQSKSSEVQDILKKYVADEKYMDLQLQKCLELKRELKNVSQSELLNDGVKKPNYISKDEAKLRNDKLLKDLEMSKARLRTLTSFTPTDDEVREHIFNYRKSSQ